MPSTPGPLTWLLPALLFCVSPAGWAQAEEPVPAVCARTPEVRDWIVRWVEEAADCADVTAAQLADIPGHIDLSDSGITTLQAGDFQGLGAGLSLNLSGNQLGTLPVRAFDGLTLSSSLDLSHNQLQTLAVGVFQGLRVGGSLNLSGNQLGTLPVGVFQGLAFSGSLDLSHNQLQTLAVGVFQGLRVGGSLELSGNQLGTLPVGVFDGLHLAGPDGTLNLSANQLGTLPVGVFRGLQIRGSLVLSDNQLQTLPMAVFDGLHITGGTLDLSRNQLQTVASLTFHGLSPDTLDLSHNQLRTPPGGFTGLGISGTLDLSNNQLQGLPSGTFDGLSLRDTLDLSHNQLQGLTTGAFVGLSLLGTPLDPSTLDLSHNQLQSLAAGVFDGLQAGQRLRLSGNRLATLPAGVFDGLYLTALYLDNNQLATLPAGVFSGLLASGVLALDHNPGAPFPLTVELRRIDAVPGAASPATLRLRLVQGVPIDISVVSLIAFAGDVSSSAIALTAGATVSGIFTARSFDLGPIIVGFGPLPALPDSYSGLQLLGSDPLELFGTADNTAPAITSAVITSTPASGQRYAAGETIEVVLSFNETVLIDATTGRPGLALQVGRAMREALYSIGGRSMNILVLRYPVVEGDRDDDGISWAADALQLRGGSLVDRSGNPANLTLPVQGDAADHQVLVPIQERTLSFEAASYRAWECSAEAINEGGCNDAVAVVPLQLEPAAATLILIPLTHELTGGATAGDYQADPNSGVVVEFEAGQVRQTVFVYALADTETESGEAVSLAFGTLPAGVQAGTLAMTAVRFQDTHQVGFATATSTTAESAGTHSAELTVSPPLLSGDSLTVTFQTTGTATTPADYSFGAAVMGRVSPYTLVLSGAGGSLPLLLATDTVEEPEETVILTLLSGGGYTPLAGSSTHTVGIISSTLPVVELARFNAAVGEGDTAIITVDISPVPTSSLTIRYTLGADANPHTEAADGADYTASNSLQIAAHTGSGNIVIPILDDDIVESPQENFAVTLDPPESAAGYTLGLSTRVVVTINEGVCDRTRQVQDWITARVPSASTCTAITAEQLAAVQGSMDLSGSDIITLQAGDFQGLGIRGSIALSGNQLTMLPIGAFDGLSSGVSLQLDNNQLTTLPAGLFQDLSLSTLNLDNNQLTTLPAGLFDDLRLSEELRLENNHLQTLPAEVFQGLGLKTLNLENNQLTTLPAGLFQGLSLSTLNLDNNRLGTLPAGLFQGLSLSTLNLDNNRLGTLPAGMFDDLHISEELRLENNQLQTLPTGVFDGLTVNNLRLSHNQLQMLSAGMFAELVAGRLWLDHNQLQALPAGVFAGLRIFTSRRTSCSVLELSYNRLQTLSVGAFEGVSFSAVSSCNILNLSNNLLETLPARAFEGLQLSRLQLDHNQLRVLPAEVFADLRISEELRLDNNQLQTLPAAAFEGLRVGSLQLYGNQLRELPAEVFAGLVVSHSLSLNNNLLQTLAAGQFRGWNLSEGLSLSNNRLTTLPAAAFTGLSTNALYLSHNRLQTLPLGVFQGLILANVLDLSNNQLTTLPAGMFESLRARTFWLDHNPGAPFSLTVEIERTDAAPSVASPAEVRLRVLEGVPAAVSPFLTLSGEFLSSRLFLSIPAGATVSSGAAVSSEAPVTISLDSLSALPGTHRGLQLLRGDPLVLFGPADNAAPTIVSTSVTSTAIKAQTYAAGELVEVTLTFDKAMLVDTTTGQPGLVLQVGAVMREARYISGGRSTDTLVFRYPVVTGDRDDDGISWAADALRLHGARLTDRPGNAASLTLPAQGDLVQHKVLAPVPEVALALASLSVNEGAEAVIEVRVNPAPASLLVVRYTLGTDTDPHTADADSADYKVGNSLRIRAGASSRDIVIPIVQDNAIEPLQEVFTVTLDLPEANAGYRLGSPATIAVSLHEGVCDRSWQVRERIVAQLLMTDCAEVTAAQLAHFSGALDLGSSAVTALRVGDFDGLRLSDGPLELSGNQLRTLPAGVFGGLSLSHGLQLGNNQLQTLPAGVFHGLTLSGPLDLSANQLRTLPAGIFEGLNLSRELRLDNNQLVALSAGVFYGLTLNGSLDLSANQLRTLPASVFHGLTLVGSLDLSVNQLRTLPAGVLYGLTLSDGLELSENQLQTLPTGMFQGLMAVLSLHHNQLTTLPAGVFAGLQVQHLRLDHNQLRALPAGVFDFLGSTGSPDSLSLDHNPGAPFPLAVELARTDAAPSAASPATLRLRLIEGAPLALAIPLVSGGTLSSAMITLTAGATASEPFTVMDSGMTTVSPGVLPVLPDTYSGLQLLGSDPLVLFATADDTAAAVTSATITSTPASSQRYVAGETIEVTLTFDKTVRVDTTTGRPGLTLQVGRAMRQARYSAGGRSMNTLVFRYPVVAGDRDDDGISWAADALQLQGGSLTDRSERAAILTLLVPGDTAAHQVLAPALEVALALATVSVNEGAEAVITVQVNPEPVSALAVRYTLGTDADRNTDDADSADYTSDNSLQIAAGADSGNIVIAITEDAVIEPLREVFTVTLELPGPDARYTLGAAVTTTVILHEGVCDRTPQVRDWIVAQFPELADCAEVTAAQLAAVPDRVELGGRGISALQAGDFAGLRLSDGLLELSGNALSTLPAGVFDGLQFSGLNRHLNLSGNQLSTLPAGVFAGLNLSSLQLQNNQLSTLPAEVFRGSGLTELLELSGNQLSTLPTGVFAGLAIRNLELSDNQLSTLPAGVFAGLSLTSFLDLSGNRLSTLPAGVFAGLAIRDLDLSGNQLSTLPAEAFAGLSLGGVLDLGQNQLSTLPAGLFDGLSLDNFLGLHDNQLSTLPAEAFADLNLSGFLHLQGNALRSLPAGVFAGLRLSSSLHLGSNQLQTLPAGVFDDLHIGGDLELSDNQLRALPTGVFSGLRLSGGLSMIGNQLQTLPAGIFNGFKVEDDFQLFGNPGAPFPLTVELQRTDAVPSAAGPAEVRLRLVHGTPVALRIPLTTVSAGISSSRTVTIAAGTTASDTFTVDAPGAVTISTGTLITLLPGNYIGLRLLGGDPLLLFATAEDTAPVISHLRVTSTPFRGLSYAAGETLEITLTFDKTMLVDTTTGQPGFMLQVGTVRREALYSAGGRSTNTLVFRYPVMEGDRDNDGIGWAADALDLHGASLTDRAGRAAVLTHAAVASNTNHRVLVPTLERELSFGAASYEARECSAEVPGRGGCDGAEATIQLQLTPAATVPITIPLRYTLRGGATATEYRVVPDGGATVVFEAWQTRQTVQVYALTDAQTESGERVSLAFGTLPAGVYAGTPATTVVQLREPSHRVSFATAGSMAAESVTVRQVPVTIAPALPAGDSLTVTFQVAGTATHLTDYRLGAAVMGMNPYTLALSGAGGSLPLQLIADTVDEPEETVTLTLLSGAGYTVGDSAHTVTIAASDLPAVALSLAAPAVREGDTAVVTVSISPASTSPLAIRYTLGADTDPHTADADSADYTASNTLQLAAGTGSIVIPITEDAVIEPPQEVFTVALDIPGLDAGYTLGSRTSVVVTLNEGVCDRTPEVRDWLARRAPDCAAVTAAQLADIPGDIDLSNSGITTLQAGDFQGINAEGALDLSDNQLQTLPIGVFEGLSLSGALNLSYNQLNTLPADTFAGLTVASLYLNHNQLSRLSAGVFNGLHVGNDLHLNDNPGAPFPLTVELQRTDAAPGAAGPAELQLRLVEGMPSAITVPLATSRGTLSRNALRFAAGTTTTDTLTVSSSGTTLVSPAELPLLNYQGLQLLSSDPLVLFAPADPAPTIINAAISSTPSRAHYTAGETIEVTLLFDNPVLVDTTSPPSLALQIGTVMREALYRSGGRGTSTLVFHYLVVAGDIDRDGISWTAQALHGGRLTDHANNPAILTVPVQSDATAHPVLAPIPEYIVSFAAASYVARECDDCDGATIQLQLTPAATTPFTIPLIHTPTGGATAADYQATPNGGTTVVFNTAQQTVQLHALADTATEPGEGVTLSFGTLPTGVHAGTPAMTTVQFQDPYRVSFSAATSTATESAGTHTVGVTVSPPLLAGDSLSINFQATGTATTADYTFSHPRMLHGPGAGFGLPLTITPDEDAEPDESIVLTLLPGADYTTEGTPHTLIIEGYVRLTALTVTPPTVSESTDATTLTITLTLSTPISPAQATEFSLTVSGSAIEDTDYTLTGLRTITVPASSSEGMTTLQLTPTQDQIPEETRQLLYTATAPGFIPQTTTLTLTDDDEFNVDFTGGGVTIADAKVLYHVLTLADDDALMAALTPLIPGLTNPALQQLLETVRAHTSNAALDLNADETVDLLDAVLFYYAKALPSSLGDGTGNGLPPIREAILGPLAPDHTDQDLQDILRTINNL